MRHSDLVVEVRDSFRRRQAVIPAQYLDLELTDLYNDVGNWKITLPAEHNAVQYLSQPGSGIVVTCGLYVFSGPTTRPTQSVNASDTKGTITFEGVSDSVYLADALAWTDPSNIAAIGDGKLTGAAETVMHNLVSANIGATAQAARQLSGLSQLSTGTGGDSVTVYRTFQPLIEILRSASAGSAVGASGLGFRMVQAGGDVRFETFVTTDRSKSVRMSIAGGDVSAQEVSVAAPTATRAIVAGTGWATSRKMIEYSTIASVAAESEWKRRIERYVDARSTNITSELQAAGLEVLTTEGNTLMGVMVTPTEDTSLTYGRDWVMGDLVTVEHNSVEYSLNVSGLSLKANGTGVRLGMLVGTDIAFPDATGQRAVAGIESRVASLEKNTGMSGVSRLVGSYSTSTSSAVTADTTLFNMGTITLTLRDGYRYRVHWTGALNPGTSGMFSQLHLKYGVLANTGGTTFHGHYSDHRSAGRISNTTAIGDFVYSGADTEMNIVAVLSGQGGTLQGYATSTYLTRMWVEEIAP